MNPYLSELHPELRLIVDELPPLGKKIWMVTVFGNGFSGDYHPEYRVLAWCPLPKLTPEQKRRLTAMKAAGIDPTVHPGKLWGRREENPPSCIGYEK